MRALHIAATGMQAQELNVEVISNNIANLNTTGYKRNRAEFQDLLYQTLRRAGANTSDAGTLSPSGINLGLGVKTGATYSINQQGEVLQTGNPLDLAIQGEGFFSVQLPDGTVAYTRAGSFQLSADGEIVTADGYIVDPGISVPTSAVQFTINQSGEVIATNDDGTLSNLGQFDLHRFLNPAGLSALGNNLFIETDASGTPTTSVPGDVGFGRLLQGFLESSNVNIVAEITSLITAQRAYELNSRVIQAGNEMLQTTSQLTS